MNLFKTSILAGVICLVGSISSADCQPVQLKCDTPAGWGIIKNDTVSAVINFDKSSEKKCHPEKIHLSFSAVYQYKNSRLNANKIFHYQALPDNKKSVELQLNEQHYIAGKQSKLFTGELKDSNNKVYSYTVFYDQANDEAQLHLVNVNKKNHYDTLENYSYGVVGTTNNTLRPQGYYIGVTNINERNKSQNNCQLINL